MPTGGIELVDPYQAIHHRAKTSKLQQQPPAWPAKSAEVADPHLHGRAQMSTGQLHMAVAHQQRSARAHTCPELQLAANTAAASLV